MIQLTFRQRAISMLVYLVLMYLTVFPCYVVFAHDPHDIVDSLAISPAYDKDKTGFLIMQEGIILKTSDGGFSWKKLVNGIDTKYRLHSITVSPNFDIDKTLFLSTKGDGIFKSQDGGSSWFRVNQGLDHLVIGLLAMSPSYNSNKVVVAAGSEGGLYQTKNGGGEWHQVIDNSKRIRSIAFYPNAQDNRILVGDVRGNLYLSTDKGEQWRSLSSIQDCGAITAIAISPNILSDGVIFVGTEKGGIWKSKDNGASFHETNEGMSGKYVTSIALFPDFGSNPIVFVATWHEAVFKSSNGGDTWSKQSTGLAKHRQADSERFRSPHFRDLRISKTFSNDKTIFLGCYVGVFKSTDGGHTWLEMETRPPKLIRGITLSPSDNGKYTIALITFLGGVYTSDDRGKTWSIKNKGLVNLENNVQNDIVFSPNYHVDNQMFTVAKRCFLKSDNQGNGWDHISLNNVSWKRSWKGTAVNGLKKLGVPKRISKRFFGYSESKRKWIWPYRLAVSPSFASDRTIYLAGRIGNGVFRSTDGGLSFSEVLEGKGQKVTSLIISPNFAYDKTLFASVRAEGVYKTTDRGGSWELKSNGIPIKRNVKLLVWPNYRLAISPHYGKDTTLFMGTERGLFKTVNGGENWMDLKINTSCGSDTVKNIAVSPDYKNDKTVFMSLKGKGLFRSQDSGLTWEEIGSELINNNYDLRFIRFSPLFAIDHTMYGAADEELFYSTDIGNTWKIIKRPVRYENVLEPLQFNGEWETEIDKEYSASSVSYSEVENNRAVLKFVGTAVRWIGTKSKNQGIANVYIDDEFMGTVDQFSDEREVGVLSYSIQDMPYGPHTITIEVTKKKNPQSLGYRIVVDSFDIL